MNTSRAGSNIALLAHPAPACAGYVCTLLLRRVQSFFEADVAASEEPPHRAAAACDPAFAHRRDDLVQRQIRLVGNQTQQKLRVLNESMPADSLIDKALRILP